MKQKQSIDFVLKCHQRYADKNWFDKDHFGGLMERLSYLDEGEQELILELTDRFQFQELNSINDRLLEAYNHIPIQRLNNASRILFAPLKSPYIREEKKRARRWKKEGFLNPPSKSGDIIFRLMQIVFPYKFQHSDKIILCTTAEEILSHYDNNALIVLWDDFVGSGNTAFSAIADLQLYLYNNGGYRTDGANYLVVSMYAMAFGVDNLYLFDINTYVYRVYRRAISDDINYTEPQRNNRIKMMKSIEKKVVKHIHDSYSLGYEGSETLLSILDRSPNNTFPFYWFRSQHKVPPVFPRNK